LWSGAHLPHHRAPDRRDSSVEGEQAAEGKQAAEGEQGAFSGTAIGGISESVADGPPGIGKISLSKDR